MTATKEWTKIMKKSELPQQIGKEVQIKGKSIALFHLSNGEVRAIENRSPYKNGPLAEGIVSGNMSSARFMTGRFLLLLDLSKNQTMAV